MYDLKDRTIPVEIKDFEVTSEIDPKKILWDDRYADRDLVLKSGTKIILGFVWGRSNDSSDFTATYDLVMELEKDTTALEGWVKLIEAYKRHMESLNADHRTYFFEGLIEENGFVKYLFGT